MINNNLLAERLNAFRNGEPIPEPDNFDETLEREYVGGNTLFSSFITLIINFSMVFLKSLGYGFAAKTIFATDWKFIAFLAVGFSLDLILNTITDIFTKNK
jgi:hypothetical protein